jgi:chemotaxis protein MotA
MKKLDFLTPVGIVVGFGLLLWSILPGPGGLKPFLDAPSFAITIGGSFSAVLTTFDLGMLAKVPTALKNSIQSMNINKIDLVGQFKELSRIIKKDGVLAIEQEVSQMEDKFLKKGLELIVDGVDIEDVKRILDIETDKRAKVYANGAVIFKTWGGYCPAFGMLGTLVGLVQMLVDMSDPASIASGMATALITTFYGSLFANVIFNSIGTNIDIKANDEMEYLEMVVCGLESIQKGDSSRTIEEKLLSYLSDKETDAYLAQSGAEVS